MESLRRFADSRLGGAILDETTILNFRHLRDRHGLGETWLSRKGSKCICEGMGLYAYSGRWLTTAARHTGPAAIWI